VDTYIALSYWDLAAASVLVFINAGLSVIFRLRVHRSLLIAAIRMVVQLSLVGVVLTTLFSLVSPLWTGLAALVMVLFAGHEAAQRQERRYSGWWSYGLGTGCMMVSSVVVTVFALLTALRPNPWYDPRYAIPLLGMILGNCMTGIALGLDTLTTSLVSRRAGVEAQLMLGATRREAVAPVTRQALRSALMPVINSMSATGVVSLPRHDDRPDPRRGTPGRSGQIPDPRHVPDRGGNRLGRSNGGNRWCLPPHRRASPPPPRSVAAADAGIAECPLNP
jgi:putative ABC transport system permease protein